MPNLTGVNIADIKISDFIKFTTKDYNDTVQYCGTVVGICDYEVARSFEDVVAHHQAILSTAVGGGDSSMNEDISAYQFLIVACTDEVRRPFAFDPSTGKSWFTDDTVERIDPVTQFTITLFGCTRQDAIVALRILNEQGYTCQLTAEE